MQHMILDGTNNARMANATENDADTWIVEHIADNVYTLQHKASSRYLALDGGTCVNKTNVSSGTDGTVTAQQFKIQKDGAIYNIFPAGCPGQGVDRDFGAVDANIHTFGFTTGNGNQKWNIVSNGTLSTNEVDSGLTTSILYPVPSQNQLTLAGVTQATTILITDIQGKILLQKNINPGDTTIDVSSLSSGIYFVKSTKGKWAKKFIK